ncbi:MAG: hypothetical protein ACR2FK_05095 [Sphingomicrobium sp.]
MLADLHRTTVTGREQTLLRHAAARPRRQRNQMRTQNPFDTLMLALSVLFLVAIASVADAQSTALFPNKPIRFIVS